jgi:hypothetical protein
MRYIVARREYFSNQNMAIMKGAFFLFSLKDAIFIQLYKCNIYVVQDVQT